jgi:hypothetical protein
VQLIIPHHKNSILKTVIQSLIQEFHLEDQGVGGRMGSEWILGELAWGVWIGFDWLRTGTGGGLL